jgi:hypothetical protein
MCVRRGIIAVALICAFVVLAAYHQANATHRLDYQREAAMFFTRAYPTNKKNWCYSMRKSQQVISLGLDVLVFKRVTSAL